jgi:hypothetical protein
MHELEFFEGVGVLGLSLSCKLLFERFFFLNYRFTDDLGMSI